MSLALLLGLPTSEAGFKARLAQSDFLHACRADAGWSAYSFDVARHLSSLGERAEQFGFAVFRDAGLAQLTQATAAHDTVVVVSHWKGPWIAARDLCETDAARYMERLEHCDLPVAVPLKQALSHTRSTDGLLQALSDALDEPSALETSLREKYGDVVASDFTLRSLMRDELNELFDGLLQPGNRIELADGMHSKEAVGGAIASGFGGLLDLTTCTSVYLSDYLALIAGERYFSIQFDLPLPVDVASLSLWRAFELHAKGTDYITARHQALFDVTRALESIKKEGANPAAELLAQKFQGARPGKSGWLARLMALLRPKT